MSRPVVIGNVSGATGDRHDAMLKMLTGATSVDAIVGDWLSEMNLQWRALEHLNDPTKGYERPFLTAFQTAAKTFVAKDAKMVVNAGGFNPKQLALQVQKVLAAIPGNTKTVAWIEGDDVLQFCQTHPEQVVHLHDGSTLQAWSKGPAVAASAYIGAWGIVKALEEGADIVIAGRVTDASPTIGFAAWWHRWRFNDFDKLAHALAAGHLIECGPYITGGNFPGFKRLMPNYFDLSHPIAEVAHDGTTVITKQAGQNGLVSVETVKTQFVYELQGPFYFNPDVVADFTNISFSAVGEHRVRVSGVKGLPAPPLLKVAVQAPGGYQAEVALHPAGLDIKEKFESIKEMGNRILKDDIEKGHFTTMECQLYGSVPDDPQSLAEATVYIRFFVQADLAEVVQRAMILFLSNMLSAFPGCTLNMDSRSAQPKPILEFWPALVPRSAVQQMVHFAGQSFTVSEQIPLLHPSAVPKQLSYEPTSPVPLSKFGPTVRAPLGHVVYARSGDKGPNVNVGFFCAEKTPETQWDWLRSFLTTSRLRALLGNDMAKVTGIERCEFPQIRAVHFVIHGVLRTGVGTTSELDALGKNVAEFLRARQVDIPSQFYDPKAKI